MRAVHNPALAPSPVPPPRGPAPPPLTHHEIFALVGPLSRRGLQLDLPASDRAARRLVFRPCHHAADPASGCPALAEALVLQAGTGGRHMLTRHLRPASTGAASAQALDTAAQADADPMLEATLEVQGEDLGAMLAALQQVPVQRHFRRGAGWLAAHCLRLVPPVRSGRGRDAPPADGLFLVRGEVRLDAAPALRLVLRPPRVRGPSVDVELTQAAGTLPALPDDLLAVLGRGWSPLTRWRQGWRGTLRVRGSLAQRQAHAAEALHRVGAHLAQTLAEPPARYHARLRGARWAVVARRALPVALGVAVCVAAWQVQVHDLASESMLKVVANIAPPLMLLTFFAMPDLPRVEIPPLPRSRRAASWWDAPPTRPDPTPASQTARR